MALRTLQKAVLKGALSLGFDVPPPIASTIVEYSLEALGQHTDTVRGVRFSPVDNTVASASWDQTIQLWFVANNALSGRTTFKPWKKFDLGQQAHAVSFSPDGRYLVPGVRDRNIQVYDVVKGKKIKTLKGHSKSVWCVCFSPDGHTLASGSWDHKVKLWDLSTWSCRKTLRSHKAYVYSIAFSSCAKYVASGSEDGMIHIADTFTGKLMARLHGHKKYVHCLQFTRNSDSLISGGSDSSIRIWDITKKVCIRTISTHTGYVASIALTPDNRYIISGSEDRTVRITELATGEEVKVLHGHLGSVLSVSVSRDGKYIVSSSGRPEFRVRLWSLKEQLEIEREETGKPNFMVHEETQVGGPLDVKRIPDLPFPSSVPQPPTLNSSSQRVWSPPRLRSPRHSSTRSAVFNPPTPVRGHAPAPPTHDPAVGATEPFYITGHPGTERTGSGRYSLRQHSSNSRAGARRD